MFAVSPTVSSELRKTVILYITQKVAPHGKPLTSAVSYVLSRTKKRQVRDAYQQARYNT